MSNLADKISNNIQAAGHKMQAAESGAVAQHESNVASNPNNTAATRAGAGLNATGEKVKEAYHNFAGEVKKS